MLKVYQEPNDWTVSLGDLSTQKWHNNAQYKPLITTEQPASSDTTATQRANRTCNRGKPGLKCGFSDLPLTNIFAEIHGGKLKEYNHCTICTLRTLMVENTVIEPFDSFERNSIEQP